VSDTKRFALSCNRSNKDRLRDAIAALFLKIMTLPWLLMALHRATRTSNYCRTVTRVIPSTNCKAHSGRLWHSSEAENSSAVAVVGPSAADAESRSCCYGRQWFIAEFAKQCARCSLTLRTDLVAFGCMVKYDCVVLRKQAALIENSARNFHWWKQIVYQALWIAN
jgi:hypothetical protein